MSLITSVHDISESALKEIKDWLDPWFRSRADTGIREVRSKDHSVTVTRPFGPVVDLHVSPAESGLRYDTDNEGDWFYAAANVGEVNRDGDGTTVVSWEFSTGDSIAPFLIDGDGGLLVDTGGAVDLKPGSGMTVESGGGIFQTVGHGHDFQVDDATFGLILNANDTGVEVLVPINMAGNPVESVADPVAAQDAATKAYVDAHAGTGTVSSIGSADSSVTVTNPTTTPDLSVQKAPKLSTARTIDGQSFDGTANITVVAPGTHAAASKVTPVDADELPLADSAASFVLKKVTWANLKATLKTYFDTLYASAASGVASIAKSGSTPLTGAVTLSGGVNVTLTQSGNDISIAASGGGGGGGIGSSSLVYRYTVTGSDKASIDTGVDAPDAGSNDWTNGDLLEFWFIGRTDEGAGVVNVDMVVNNDTSSLYDLQVLSGNNTSVAAATRIANTGKWQDVFLHGSGGSASYPAEIRGSIADYAGTTFFKVGEVTNAVNDGTAGNNEAKLFSIGYRSTTAITRMKFAAQGAAKLKIGSQLLIYKRLAS